MTDAEIIQDLRRQLAEAQRILDDERFMYGEMVPYAREQCGRAEKAEAELAAAYARQKTIAHGAEVMKIALEAELESAKRDTERLDAVLEAIHSGRSTLTIVFPNCNCIGGGQSGWWANVRGHLVETGENGRAAIDAAREEEPKCQG